MHFTVLVLGEDILDLLEPYNENADIDPYWADEASTVADFWGTRHLINDGLLDPTCTDMTHLLNTMKASRLFHDEQYRIMSGTLQSLRHSNPKGKWDWWVVGGRWSGSLWLRPGATGTLGEDSGPMLPGRCDSALKGDLDIEGMRAAAAHDAGQRHDAFSALCAQHGTPATFEELHAHHEDLTITRSLYAAQPALAAARKAGLMGLLGDPANFRASREAYVASAAAWAVTGRACLSEGSGWLSVPGWDPRPDAPELVEYLAAANAVIDAAEEGERLTMVDCHT